MKNESIKNLIDKLSLENAITLDEIPEIDLYMDQVIQLFEAKYTEALRNEEEKVLTKTMINNYAKDKLIIPIKNKKYSKEHLILLSLIYQFKGSLSINDIKKIMNPIVKSLSEGEEFPLRKLYTEYLEIYDEDVNNFKNTVDKSIENIKPEEDGYISKMLLLSSFINMSNMYRKLAERIVDDISLSEK
ncbi:DUF1836 domain-containing protein [Clostridium sp. YIM B02551]|uniref:DUF1836 domain-containing protein n=1 Tax=Clostridium sp. YIM B02551 TaxID=2910679 RepID=UPI001EEB582E|nr:DUF1836 domain-containing protein [Clostridium sp. YIM B02551]